MNSREDRKKSRKSKYLKIILGILLVLFAGTGTYAYNIYNDVKDTVDNKVHKPVDSIKLTPEQKEKISNQEPVNILLMGVDEREHDQGRADTLIILSINPNINKMQMISIPRDSRTLIKGKGIEDKINHSYAFGGSDMTIATVENFADIELDYYAKLNMEGLVELVDALGGITVHNKLDWYDSGYYEKGFHYEKGDLNLNGEQTMGFVRMRYQDPNGDFGRNERQREVIRAIIDKGASIGSIPKIDQFLEVIGNNIETNMTFEDMKDLFSNYRSASQNSTSYQVKGNGTKIDNIYYLIVSEQERDKIHDMITDFNQKK
ncbi:cell envelope-related function transcriptional attenuator common domain-containing protein [Salinibacillus kushneri]|uniref:Cell envelope-related function transcriptional attenuator common domain-containing protein n=1 Tax=Salinibacillus kushneri TaxID=237682 RepID=A0A1H9YSY9_9BACI|nr:LCP family protein [Salinibacillus kushneri]SES72274.1 cell envelope-related function transcriptional attenuator common domain-containing protein [Salinibacillus kushneri]